MAQIAKGILGAFVLHLIGAFIAIGTTILFTNSYDDASDDVKRDLDGSAMPEGEVLLDLSDAYSALMEWVIIGFLVGFVCTVIYLISSIRTDAATPPERSRLRPVWIVLLLVNFFAMVAAWWFVVASPEATFAMVFSNYATVLGLTFLTLLLVYFLSTALFVRKLMAPSVPLAAVIRGV